MKAAEARDFGASRAAAFGATLVKKLDELGVPRLAALAARLTSLVSRLSVAQGARADATDAARLFDIRRTRLVGDVETQVALTAIEIFKVAPGDKALVAAILSPEAYKSRATKPEKPVEPTA